MRTNRIEHSPHGAPHTLTAKLAKANADRNGNMMAKQRGAPEWYQDLVDYYLERRSVYSDYWSQVGEQYNLAKNMASRRNVRAERDIIPGRVYSIVHGTEAEIVGSPPKFHFEGWTPAVDAEIVPAFERGLNNEWHEDRSLMRAISLTARDCVKTGWGIALTSYVGPSTDGATREQASANRQAEVQNPLMGAISDTIQSEVAAELAQGEPEEQLEDHEQDSRVRTGTISTRRISPWHFIIDPDATSLEDAAWVGRIIISRLDAVKSDPNLKHTESLQATSVESFDFYGDRAGRNKWRRSNGATPYDLVEMYEIFERREDGRWDMVVIARDHDRILRKEEAIYWVGCPYSILRWNDDGEEIFAQSDITVVQDEIDAECLLYTKSMDGYARDHEDTLFIHKDAGISDKDWYAVTKPGVSKKIEVDVPQGQNIREVIHKMPRDAKSPEPLNFLSMLQRAIELGSGRGPNQNLQAMKSDTSAREAAIVESRSQAMNSHRARAMESFVLDVAMNRLGLMVQFYDKERISRIAGEDAANAWQGGPLGSWTESDIHLGMRVRVERGSMRPRNDAQVFQDLVALAQISGQNPILMGNTNWVTWQKEAYKALLGVAGENLMTSRDEEEIAQASRNMVALQNQPGGGSPPSPGGVASQAGPPRG